MSVSTSGYRFSYQEQDAWTAFSDGELRQRKWLHGGKASLSRDGHGIEIVAQFPDKPQLLCFSSGELTAFQLDLSLGDVAQRYRLDGQPDGTVKLLAVDSRVR